MYNYDFRKIALGRILPTIVLIIILIGINWIFTHSYISIKVSDYDPSVDIKYVIKDKNGEIVRSVQNKTGMLKTLVKSGDYEVLVTQNDKSFYGISDKRSLLRTANLAGSIVPENHREFIGENPAPCMFYDGSILFSSGCYANFAALKEHIPATASSPTYVKNPSDSFDKLDVIEMLSIKSQSKILLGNVPQSAEADTRSPGDTEAKPAFVLYDLTSELTLQNGIRLDGLEPSKAYSATPYKDGLIVYDNNFDKIIYFEAPEFKPTEVVIDEPQDSDMQPMEVSVYNDIIAVAYSNNPRGEVSGQDGSDSNPNKGKIIVNVINNKQRYTYTFKGSPAYARLCGDISFCIVNNREMSVYKISGKSSDLLFNISGINKFVVLKNEVILVKDTEVVGLNLKSKRGSIQYSNDEYKGCGISSFSPTSYILCERDFKNNLHALRIDTEKDNTDNIDKKFLGLIDDSVVDSATPYKSFIYISPNLGERKYQEATKTYTYSIEDKKRAAERINKLTKELKIDNSQYTVINTLP